MGVGVAAALIWFPQTEGRAKDLDLIHIYMDPVIAYIYLGSIPFFMALLQAFKLLMNIERNKTFSPSSVKILQTIKYCAISIVCLMAGLISWIAYIGKSTGDDSAGAVAVGIVIIFISIVMATFAAILQKLFQNAVDIKSENDLTV
jgi:hypothetical protein